jgi:hypothetical protein
MKINKPIIIIGTGRSGSTIFHNVFSHFDKLAWISSLANKTPNNFKKHQLLMKGLDVPIIENILTKKFLVGEGYNFWDFYANGFSTPFRDLTEDDLSIRFKNNLNTGMSKLLTKSRNRLLLKITGWPRITFLKSVFPDAKFIHIIRDGRAVANSLINVDFWWGWRGPNNWRWGELSKDYYEEWLKYDKSFIALAAIEWKIIMDALEIGKKALNKNNFLEIKYKDLCENPINEFEKVFEFSELEMTKKFKRFINDTSFRNTNSKWQKELNEKQKTILNDVLYDYLVKYGYE